MCIILIAFGTAVQKFDNNLLAYYSSSLKEMRLLALFSAHSQDKDQPQFYRFKKHLKEQHLYCQHCGSKRSLVSSRTVCGLTDRAVSNSVHKTLVLFVFISDD